ncbi:MAG: hypothetical protein LBD04_04035 [Synergistaceae bacterium]|nr:hypothetical protein [Synergistaceae bacterium]
MTGEATAIDEQRKEPMEGSARQEAGQVFVPQYDVTSKERYVDSTTKKTDFEKVLDELAHISMDALSWDILRMTRKHFGDTEENDARKLEAFLGAFIINAAVVLHDKGLGHVARKKLDQAKVILDAKEKLMTEVSAIQAKVEESAIDLSDMLGLFDER